ncbi:hypothetical protein V2H29_03930 [Lysinibacillus fusiformis]|uniref:Uncharacterized protein n=1 Tax=Lysinibacillus fusiformis TaxID=28031 RepID=A0A2I0UVB7_9BACI|nr:hypothetical protein [Lysinibacillus fusiformis]MEE3806095.1 hypothetical protein [Lysinibacillus fusiformis]PKU49948.1 hypothetical protein CRI88_20395 [Lysinibacillus fusiformis]
MNVKIISSLVQHNVRTTQEHLVDIREFIEDYATDSEGKNYFSELDAEAYFIMVKVTRKKNSKNQGIRALIEFLERRRILDDINRLLKK